MKWQHPKRMRHPLRLSLVYAKLEGAAFDISDLKIWFSVRKCDKIRIISPNARHSVTITSQKLEIWHMTAWIYVFFWILKTRFVYFDWFPDNNLESMTGWDFRSGAARPITHEIIPFHNKRCFRSVPFDLTYRSNSKQAILLLIIKIDLFFNW